MNRWFAALIAICLLALPVATAEEVQFVDVMEVEAPIDEIELELAGDIEDIVHEEVLEIDLGEDPLSDSGELAASSNIQSDAVPNASGVAIDETNFPDEIFREYVLRNCDTDEDGTLSENEISATTHIVVGGDGISSLKGIEFFAELLTLACTDNQLTSLDLTGCGKLEYLYCSNNQLTSLNVQNCTALKLLYCGSYELYSGNQLASLDLSKCTALTDLICSDNQLTKLDLSKCTALTHLECEENKLTELIVNKCKAMNSISCYSNRLTKLDVSSCPALICIECGSNQLRRLDISECIALKSLECWNNQLASLDVSNCNALENLVCYNNQLTSLDVSRCTSLTELNCGGNKLTNLNVRDCKKLETLVCGASSEWIVYGGNLLTDIDLSSCISLTNLYCNDNRLTSLDMSKCAKLNVLCCQNNQLTALDVSKCPHLKTAIKKGEFIDEGYSRYRYDPSNFYYNLECDTNVVITPKPAKAHIAACAVAIEDAVYTGKALKPAVTVKYGTAKLKAGTDYTVSYKNNKKIGTATVVIKGKGSYVGEKTASFNIVPKAVTGLKLKAGKKQLAVSWKKVSGVTGYQLEYSLKKNFSSPKQVSVSKATTVKKTLKNLKKGKTYYVRIRAYKDVNGQTYWSAWSAAKKAEVK